MIVAKNSQKSTNVIYEKRKKKYALISTVKK